MDSKILKALGIDPALIFLFLSGTDCYIIRSVCKCNNEV